MVIDHSTVLIVVALIFGFYMTWNIGANDVANAMGTSVGSRALTIKKAIMLAAVLEFSGAFFVGSNVSETIQNGVINPSIFINNPSALVYGMLAALLATSLWLQLATYYGWPVSTTHSIIGSLFGFGIVYGGLDAIYWTELTSIVLSWIISPILGATLAFLLFSLIQKRIFYSPTPLKSAKKTAPLLFFFLFTVFALSLFLNGLKNLHLDLHPLNAIALSIGIGIVAAFVSHFFLSKIESEPLHIEIKLKSSSQVMSSLNKSLKYLRRTKTHANIELEKNISQIVSKLEKLSYETQKEISKHKKTSDFSKVERLFIPLQIASAGFVAFAHGANDVANAIGPLAAIYSTLKSGKVALSSLVPTWMLALGGLGIVIGLATWGWRVIETIGKKITDLTPTRGFSAELGAATTILLASKLGLPISTTHTLVGAVLGVGLARGMGALNLKIIRNIVGAWVVTIPAGAILTIIIFYIFKMFFLH